MERLFLREAIRGRADQNYAVLSNSDLDALVAQAEGLMDKGWNVWDVLEYISCTEEVNPKLKEEYALQRMKNISSKYGPMTK